MEVLWTPPTWSNGRDAHVREGGRVALASPLVGRRASNVGPGARDVRPRVVWEHAALDSSPRARRRALSCCAHMLVAVLKGRLVRGARGVCPGLCSSMLINLLALYIALAIASIKPCARIVRVYGKFYDSTPGLTQGPKGAHQTTRRCTMQDEKAAAGASKSRPKTARGSLNRERIPTCR